MRKKESKIIYVRGVKVTCNYQSKEDKAEVEDRVLKILITSSNKRNY